MKLLVDIKTYGFCPQILYVLVEGKKKIKLHTKPQMIVDVMIAKEEINSIASIKLESGFLIYLLYISILIRRHMQRRNHDIVTSERAIESFLGNVEEWLLSGNIHPRT